MIDELRGKGQNIVEIGVIIGGVEFMIPNGFTGKIFGRKLKLTIDDFVRGIPCTVDADSADEVLSNWSWITLEIDDDSATVVTSFLLRNDDCCAVEFFSNSPSDMIF